MKKKKIIIGIIILLIATIIIVVAIKTAKGGKETKSPEPITETKQESQIKQVNTYIGELSDGAKINTNAKVNEPSSLGDLSIDNIRLTLKNGITTFRANVTNNGTTKTELKNINLSLLDEEGKEIVNANGVITPIEASQSQELAISITSNYIDASSYKITEE